ncbi:L-arabinose transport system ATP-binding protein [Geodermatophilus telluris]|uniref:L-arabinose transport system ATP-binding protein n=1 Tax=Geodermatophilus telluris TaxID=1190417 RepID=A0A1G6SY81_9ACTN|nr:sugar ABC transporter ATP-binding protein [Geodermatophilus telluris]SDD21758.1 L-arabinose transport system ATP-binding protein [Geodermatophilus telluris]
MTTTSTPPTLVAEGIGKSFAGVHALTDVTLEIRPGEVLALMGENGAGKSTLLKILSGDQPPDTGTLRMHGEPVTFSSPADAMAAGVRVIYQEPEIVPHVSVAENVYIGRLPATARRFNRRALRERVRADLERTGFTGAIDPDTLGSRLSAAQRQLIEILRALTSDTAVLAFDEPTSSLSDAETESLFRLIRELRESGVAIVYVSHRMKEIFELADRIAVLRDGRLIGVRPAAETDEEELVRMMVGRDLSSMFQRRHTGAADQPVASTESRRPVLELRGVTSDDVSDVDLVVHAGEVVGLAGLVGAGRSELARAVVGDVPLRGGQVVVNGRPLRLRTPGDAVAAGIGFAPEERKADALLMHRTVRDNLSLAVLDRLSRLRFVRTRAERELVDRYVEQLRVRTPSPEQQIRKLSGGNQQKVVLARWLARRPDVLILDEPTRGVDVGAKAEIYAIIDELAASGVALLVISSELPEVLGLSDRIVVMQNGRIAGELDRDEATEERILALAIADHAAEGASR